jgi:hypothetical protein
VQIFDQVRALARRVPEQALNFVCGMGVDLAAFGDWASSLAAAAWMLEFADFANVYGDFVVTHTGTIVAEGPPMGKISWERAQQVGRFAIFGTVNGPFEVESRDLERNRRCRQGGA